MLWKHANSSLSKVEYLDSVESNFLEKKPRGCHAPCTCCCSTPPTCVSEASVARESTAPGAAWESGTAAVSAVFACWKADTMFGDQESFCGLPAKAAVRGGHGACHPWHEPPVEIAHAQKTLQTFYITWLREVPDDGDVAREGGDARGGDGVAQHLQAGRGENTLLEVDGEPVGGQDLENLPQMIEMLLVGAACHQQVV